MQETQEMQLWSLGWEDPLEKEIATHSSVLAWEIPWTRSLQATVHRVTKSQTWPSSHASRYPIGGIITYRKLLQLTLKHSISSVYLPSRYILKTKRVKRNQFSFSILLANQNASIAIFTETQLTYNTMSLPSVQHSDPILHRLCRLHVTQYWLCVSPSCAITSAVDSLHAEQFVSLDPRPLSCPPSFPSPHWKPRVCSLYVWVCSCFVIYVSLIFLDFT